MDAKKIISHTFTFEEAEEMLKMSLSREKEIIKAVLIPESK